VIISVTSINKLISTMKINCGFYDVGTDILRVVYGNTAQLS